MYKRCMPASFIALAIAMALAGGAVLAAGGTDDGSTSSIFRPAAQVLGIDVSELETAHVQAATELLNEHMQETLLRLVDSGLLQQEESDTFLAWMSDRPESADDALLAILSNPSFAVRSMSDRGTRLRRLGIKPNGYLIERMAQILGIDKQELADAISRDSTEPASVRRMAMMHDSVDRILESGWVDADEASELHTWVDKIPPWVLNTDLALKILPAFFMERDHFLDSGFHGNQSFNFPFGRNHFGDGRHKFHFEYHGPDGTFRLRPDGGDEATPMDAERLQELFDRFDLDSFRGLEGLKGLENLDDLLESFGESGYFDRPFIDPHESKEGVKASETPA